VGDRGRRLSAYADVPEDCRGGVLAAACCSWQAKITEELLVRGRKIKRAHHGIGHDPFARCGLYANWKPAPNHLKKGRVTRALKTGPVQVKVKYSLRNRVQRWSPGVDQALTVSLTARSSTIRLQSGAATKQRLERIFRCPP
jgi:hypothetical protein